MQSDDPQTALRNIPYTIYDKATGDVVVSGVAGTPKSINAKLQAGQGLLLDVQMDPRVHRVDLATLEAVPRPPPPPPELEEERVAALANLDMTFIARLSDATGPFASLHAEKRRQAEAGGGPLVVDEEDRLAILANAKAQNEAIAAIERQRRETKAALRAATTEDEIKAILASI